MTDQVAVKNFRGVTAAVRARSVAGDVRTNVEKVAIERSGVNAQRDETPSEETENVARFGSHGSDFRVETVSTVRRAQRAQRFVEKRLQIMFSTASDRFAKFSNGTQSEFQPSL